MNIGNVLAMAIMNLSSMQQGQGICCRDTPGRELMFLPVCSEITACSTISCRYANPQYRYLRSIPEIKQIIYAIGRWKDFNLTLMQIYRVDGSNSFGTRFPELAHKSPIAYLKTETVLLFGTHFELSKKNFCSII